MGSSVSQDQQTVKVESNQQNNRHRISLSNPNSSISTNKIITNHQNKELNNQNFNNLQTTTNELKSKLINDDTLSRFLEVQSQIEGYERSGVFDGLKSAEEEFEIIEKNKRQAEINYKVLDEQTKKEKQDFENISSPTVQSFFRNKQDHDKAISKEQEEYLHSLNLLEIAGNELKAITLQFEHSKSKLENYKKQNQKAIELYNEQMKILHSTFEGDYGSVLENTLEEEVSTLKEQKDQLRSALNKWSNARFLLVYAYNQLQCAEQRWIELMKLDIRNPEKVIFATEVRNNLVAANQNLNNTRSYLKNVDLPYCTDEDLHTLQSLSAGTYQDMLSVDRQHYVLEIIQILRQRCAALNQWFNQVIKETLVVDYSKVKLNFDSKSKKLKLERIRLLQEKIKEKTGKEISLNLLNMVDNSRREPTMMMSNSIVNSSLGISNDLNGRPSKVDINEQPISNSELPPPPSKEQILGNVEEIKQQYKQQVQDWNKHMEQSRKEADQRLEQLLAQYNK